MTDVRGVGAVGGTEFNAPKIRRVQQPAQPGEVTDSVEISSTAIKATEVARFTELAKTSPDIRADVVERAKQRVTSGEYLSEKVTRRIAEKILDSL